ncbi:MAG TPA: diguanylate cyclase [Fibrobacteria bacterium]|nr:diguanylate cyclase [Fibrobacteria bacterium]
MTEAWMFLAGLLAGMGLLGGPWRFAWIPAAASLLIGLLARRARGSAPFNPSTPPMGTQKIPAPTREARASGGWEEDTRRDTVAFLKSDLKEPSTGKVPAPGKPVSAEPTRSGVQSREARRQGLQDLEEAIDACILDGLSLLKQAMPGGLTYAVFFPGRGERLYLRAWITDSEDLLPGAALQSHQGLVGQLLKEGVKRILEGDIVADSTQLHYYGSHVGVRSLVGVPILVKGTCRGAVVVDSLKPVAFDAADVERLESLANLIGRLAFHAYMDFESAFHKDQLAALSTYQRKFLANMSVENIVTNVVDYMVECLEGDRFLVLVRESPSAEGQGDAVRVLRCAGKEAECYEDAVTPLAEIGILQLAFDKEQVINRGFTSGQETPRLGPGRGGPKVASLLVVPVPTDQGVDMALAVESSRPRRFSEHQQDMLATIARAAGFALSRARLYQQKEQLASRDGLTGVENHRTFQDRFQGEILRAQRYSHQLAILMMDLDFFKKVNDTYGHPTGDLVLKEVASIIAGNIRGGVDLLARYGGEEFVCMLSDTDRDRAGETAERIRESVARKVFESGAARFQVTISIGGAMYPADSRRGREVLEKADKALYHAKETGRNRLVFYN